jgi:hypothetical protein
MARKLTVWEPFKGLVPFDFEQSAYSSTFFIFFDFSMSSRIVSILVLVGGARARWIWSME